MISVELSRNGVNLSVALRRPHNPRVAIHNPLTPRQTVAAAISPRKGEPVLRPSHTRPFPPQSTPGLVLSVISDPSVYPPGVEKTNPTGKARAIKAPRFALRPRPRSASECGASGEPVIRSRDDRHSRAPNAPADDRNVDPLWEPTQRPHPRSGWRPSWTS